MPECVILLLRSRVCFAECERGTLRRVMKLGAVAEGVEEGVREAFCSSESVACEAEDRCQGRREEGEDDDIGHRMEVKFEDPWKKMDPCEMRKYMRHKRNFVCHGENCKSWSNL